LIPPAHGWAHKDKYSILLGACEPRRYANG